MAYVNKKEQELLIWIENTMFDILEHRPDLFGSPDDFMENYLMFYEKYRELWVFNEKIIKSRELDNIKSRDGMRKYRNSPDTKEIAKQKARDYSRKYYAKKTRTPEEQEQLREYWKQKQRESRDRKRKKDI